MSDGIKLVMMVIEVAMVTIKVEEIIFVWSVAMAEGLDSRQLAIFSDVENVPTSNSKNYILPSEQLPGQTLI